MNSFCTKQRAEEIQTRQKTTSSLSWQLPFLNFKFVVRIALHSPLLSFSLGSLFSYPVSRFSTHQPGLTTRRVCSILLRNCPLYTCLTAPVRVPISLRHPVISAHRGATKNAGARFQSGGTEPIGECAFEIIS